MPKITVPAHASSSSTSVAQIHTGPLREPRMIVQLPRCVSVSFGGYIRYMPSNRNCWPSACCCSVWQWVFQCTKWIFWANVLSHGFVVNIVAVHSTRRPLCGDAAGGSAIGERVLLFLAFGGGSWVARPTKSAADCAGLTAVDKSWMCMVFFYNGQTYTEHYVRHYARPICTYAPDACSFLMLHKSVWASDNVDWTDPGSGHQGAYRSECAPGGCDSRHRTWEHYRNEIFRSDKTR